MGFSICEIDFLYIFHEKYRSEKGKRNSQFFVFFSFHEFANLSCYDATFSKLVNREIETVVLNTINPMNSKKWLTTFKWIFHFSLIDFSKKIFENLFHKWGTPLGYMKLTARSKKSKTYCWGRYGLLQTCSF